MAIDNVVTSSTYNAYITVAEADILVAAKTPFYDTTEWDALTPTEKENLILRGTASANTFSYVGSPSNVIVSPYGMQWPRQGVSYCNGVPLDSVTIPEFIKEYVAERCLEILSFTPSDANSVKIPNNVKRNKIGSLEQEFFGPKDMVANTLTLRDFVSYQIIECYVVKKGNVTFLERA